MARCRVKKLDKDTCLDFSTRGDLPNDKYREGWDRIFGRKDERVQKTGRPPSNKRP